MKELRMLTIIICVLQSLDFVETDCTHLFGAGTYISSTRGTWTTTNTTIANYKFTFGSLTTTITLTCYIQNDTNKYIFRHYFRVFSNIYLYLYTCLDIRNSTYSDKYYFYEATEFDTQSGDHSTADGTNVCNRANYLTAVETKVVIKQGKYDTNKVYCPNIILGNYTYNTTDDYSDMDSCNNKQQLTFKKNKATYVALSSGGNLACMYSGIGTYIYLITFNNETVDNTNTYQFTCFAFSFSGYGSVVYASQRPKSCSSSQTPTSADSSQGKTFIFTPYVTCHDVCTFPSHFQSSTYEDSYKGTLTFTTNSMTGWTVMAYGNTITNWQCLIATSYDASSGGLLVFKATDSITALGSTFYAYYAYLCLNITKVTDNSFYYYQMNGEQVNANNERVLITADNTLSTVGATCNATYGGNVAEFKVLLKSGTASTAAQNVSTELFANFDYTYTDASGNTACASSSDNWVFCDTRVSMTFNFSTCSQSIAYGTSGIWYHIVTLSLSYNYMVVYNSAASHKFTCFAFTDNTKTTYVYDYCRSGQTNTVFPTVASVTIGAKLTMTPYTYCPDAPSDNEKLKEAADSNPTILNELPPKPGLAPINVTQPNGVPMNDVKPVQKKPLPAIGKPTK